ncbi:MAG TPA: TIM barrel protein [Egibacteraceae bacterium]|mgnify:CR=1 FL=1
MALEQIAGAPISWGVCEVPGWGHQMTPQRVFAEMAALGLTATEAGPDGFLPDDPQAASELLAGHGLRLVGGFVPAVLHDPDDDAWREVVDAAAARFAAAGADVLVLAADTGSAGYDVAADLDETRWRVLLDRLDAARDLVAARGLRLALHPHVGTVVERREHVERVLEGSGVPLCVDTGHLLVGGSDPVAIVRGAVERVGHVHLKDVDAALAERVRSGEVSYSEAVRAGLYRPLGAGDVDVAALVDALAAVGYDGWYVLEQDVVLDVEPPPGAGPARDVAASAAHLRGLLRAATGRPPGAL